MVSPLVIQVFFWLGAAAILALPLVVAVLALTEEPRAEGHEIRGGVCVLIILTPMLLLLWRILCEVLILLFRINENLLDIKSSLEKRMDTPAERTA